MTQVLAGAEPFAFEGNDIGVLVSHGFTGTPQSMRHYGEQLHRRFGFSVVGPRLPGHGTSPDDMETTGYLDWAREIEQQLKGLAARKRKVFVTGLSMGGTLTLNMAARFPELVQGIATIAAAAGPLKREFAGVLALDPAPRRIPGIGSDIKAPGVQELAYGEVPVACMREITALIAQTGALMGGITCPALFIHGREDHVVPPSNALHIVNTLASGDIRLLWLENSYHVATLDNDKDLIVERVGRFFAELAAG